MARTIFAPPGGQSGEPHLQPVADVFVPFRRAGYQLAVGSLDIHAVPGPEHEEDDIRLEVGHVLRPRPVPVLALVRRLFRRVPQAVMPDVEIEEAAADGRTVPDDGVRLFGDIAKPRVEELGDGLAEHQYPQRLAAGCVDNGRHGRVVGLPRL